MYSLHQKKTISRHYGCTNTEDFVESYLCLGNLLLMFDYNSFIKITDSLPPLHYEESGIIPSDTLAVPPLPLPDFKEATPDDSTEEENGMIPADAIAVPTLPPLPGYKNAIADESSEAVTCIEVRQKKQRKNNRTEWDADMLSHEDVERGYLSLDPDGRWTHCGYCQLRLLTRREYEKDNHLKHERGSRHKSKKAARLNTLKRMKSGVEG